MAGQQAGQGRGKDASALSIRGQEPQSDQTTAQQLRHNVWRIVCRTTAGKGPWACDNKKGLSLPAFSANAAQRQTRQIVEKWKPEMLLAQTRLQNCSCTGNGRKCDNDKAIPQEGGHVCACVRVCACVC